MTRRSKLGLAALFLLVLITAECIFGWLRHGLADLLASNGQLAPARLIYATLASDRDPLALNNYAVLLDLYRRSISDKAARVAVMQEVRTLYERAVERHLKVAEDNYTIFMFQHAMKDTELYVNTLAKLKEAADAGDAPALLEYTDYLYFHRDDPDFPKRVAFLKQLADQGIAEAQKSYGDTRRPEDDAEAERYYRLAAEQGHFSATEYMGTLYWSHQIPRDDKLEWLTKAAEMGSIPSQANLGEVYKSGDGVPAAPAKASRWLEMAARHLNVRTAGDPWCQFDRSGYRGCVQINGVQANINGDISAAYELAELYAQGLGVPQDLKKARDLYAMAAEGKWKEAQQHLQEIDAKLSSQSQQ